MERESESFLRWLLTFTARKIMPQPGNFPKSWLLSITEPVLDCYKINDIEKPLLGIFIMNLYFFVFDIIVRD